MASKATWDKVEAAKKRIRFNERMAEVTVRRYRQCGAVTRRGEADFRAVMLAEISGPVNQRIADAVESDDRRIFHDNYRCENGVSVITTSNDEGALIRELLKELVEFAPSPEKANPWIRAKLTSIDSILRTSRAEQPSP